MSGQGPGRMACCGGQDIYRGKGAWSPGNADVLTSGADEAERCGARGELVLGGAGTLEG